MPSATPIRLVQENGNLIELDAQEMTLTTTRKVGGSPIPFTGSKRFGFDLNVNQAMINIRGVIADDRSAGVSTSASAVINFARGNGDGYDNRIFTEVANLTALLGQKLEIANSSGTKRYVTFSSGSATEREGSTNNITVNTSTATAAQLAAAMIATINGEYSSDFTASATSTSDPDGAEDSWGVFISMVTTGTVTSNAKGTPRFVADGSVNSGFYSPEINTFSGGTTGKKKSAGDKVMDLYGILNNSVTQAGREVVGFGIMAAGALTLNPVGLAAGVVMGARVMSASHEERDYITGLQIPYNSSIKAENGELYTARNFFMPTGIWGGVKGLGKTSEGNDHPASIAFDQGDKFTGIQGSVQKMDISYDAGETVYTFNMIFTPIDMLV